MNLLKNRLKYAFLFGGSNSHTKLVSLFINDRNPRTNKFIRISLKKNNGIVQLMHSVIKPLFSPQNTKFSNKLVKKCVRIDEDLWESLRRNVGFNESYISTTVSNAVVERIKSRVIDVIETKSFNHKITVRFTQDKYNLVKQTINELKAQGLKRITFSLLVRSILYEHFKLVIDIKNEANSNVA